MNLLVCCEESQAVCKAFLKQGVNAYSCDLQACSGGMPERHIIGDCLELVYGAEGGVWFTTEAGSLGYVDYWDMIICHPPCTYLSNAGNASLYDMPGMINKLRYEKGMQAKEFFLALYNAPVRFVVIENPVPSRVYGLPDYSQIVCPSEFGADIKKRTCLWLRNVPPLIQMCRTLNATPTSCADWFQRHGKKIRQKNRSKTALELADAMAVQWSRLDKIS